MKRYVLLLIAITSYVTYGAVVTQEEARDIAARVLDTVPLIDGHNDWPMNMRDLIQNQLARVDFRQNLTNDPVWGVANCDTCRTDIPRLQAGKLGAEFWVAYVSCRTQYMDAVEQTMEQIDVIHRLIEQYSDVFQFVTTPQGIEDAFAAGKIGSLIGVEGGHSIDNRLAVLRLYYQMGARYLTLTHSCTTPWGDSSIVDKPEETPVHDGLTEFGKTVVREMNRLGMLVDLSHTSQNVQIDAIGVSRAPVVFTHSGAKTICDSHRNVHDDVLQLLKVNNGIIMVTFYNWHAGCSSSATMQDVIDQINYIRRTIGVDHVGIGSDFDGIELQPVGLEDVSKYPDLFESLAADPVEPWAEDELIKLASSNFLRVFRDVERVRDEMATEGQTAIEDLIPAVDLSNNTFCMTPASVAMNDKC